MLGFGVFFKLCGVFVAALELSLVETSGGLLFVAGPAFSPLWLLLLQNVDSRLADLVVVVHGLSCPEECGIFLDQELNLCLLHWQVNSLPLSH